MKPSEEGKLVSRKRITSAGPYVDRRRTERVHSGLARQAPWRHLLHSWLDQGKPGWSAQACKSQVQSAIDGARRLVWPEPNRLHPDAAPREGLRGLHNNRGGGFTFEESKMLGLQVILFKDVIVSVSIESI